MITAVDSKTKYFFVLVHGLDGNESDLTPMKNSIMKVFGDTADVLISVSNAANTYIGVESLGENLVKEIVSRVETFDSIHEFIVIGHSLGGLISRYALGVLHENDLTCHNGEKSRLRWHSFTSMCTPHLGVRKPGYGSINKKIWKFAFYLVVPCYHSVTGRDLMLYEKTSKKYNPKASILYQMTIPGSRYMKALECFDHRTAMAMADHDLLVPYATASIRNHNPWKKEKYSFQSGWEILGHYGFTNHVDILHPYLAMVDDYIIGIETSTDGDDTTTPVYFKPSKASSSSDTSELLHHDNHKEVEIIPEMMKSLQSVRGGWRRLDIAIKISSPFLKPLAHTFCIEKRQFRSTKAKQFSEMLVSLLQKDLHQKSRVEMEK